MTQTRAKMLNPKMPNTAEGQSECPSRRDQPTPRQPPPPASKPGLGPSRPLVAQQLLASGRLALMLLLALPCQSYQLQHEPVASNEIPRQPAKGSHQDRSREVTNLRLTPGLRSVKLRWDYEPSRAPHDGYDWPVAFRIRFCELTSWQTEIKCRQRDLQVQRINDSNSPPAALEEIAGSPAGAKGGAESVRDNTTVIFKQSRSDGPQEELVRVVVGGGEPQPGRANWSRTYEAQIFDLRALTGYTFSVQVARFAGDTAHADLAHPGASTSRAARPARRLDLGGPSGAGASTANELGPSPALESKQQLAGLRVETKPFGAEALRCLANSSEVLVNTGRFFGGRISVEGAPSGACHLVGNKSSAQSVYLFRIDHEQCGSRVLDSQRIETMILVHENRDLLTHNTARFLIQCNIAQRSFTVRASVSLPKVNSLTPPRTGENGARQSARPATITALAGPHSRREEPVRLGSMPGVYRLIRANQPPTEGQSVALTTQGALHTRAPASGRRESKELQEAGGGADHRTAQALVPPKPVDVSSGVLFVGRSQRDEVSPTWRESRAFSAPGPPLSGNAMVQGDGPRLEVAASSNQQASVVMTNNHRVAGEFLPLAQAVANLDRVKSARGESSAPFSIKYSPESVDEYPLARELREEQTSREPSLATTTTTTTTSSQLALRSRSGRMRQIDQQPQPQLQHTTREPATAAATSKLESTSQAARAKELESRMGESRQRLAPQRSDLIAHAGSESAESLGASESSHIESRVSSQAASATTPPANSTAAFPSLTPNLTLAQNLTGALIRWSLRTLGSLARKSLDALASEAEHAASNESLPVVAATAFGEHEESEHKSTHADGARVPSATRSAHESVLDGFLVDQSETTRRRHAALGQHGAVSATTVSSQQQARAATQSADLKDSRRPHQLVAPPSQQGPSARQTSSVTPTPSPQVTTSSSQRPARRREQKARSEQASPRARMHSTNAENASLLPPAEDNRPLHPSQAAGHENVRSAPSSLWPVYCLWSLVGILGLVTLGAFLLVSSRGAPLTQEATCGSLESAHSRHLPGGSPGLLAQLNDALRRHPAGGGHSAPGLPQQNESQVRARQQVGSLVQSPSVQRRELTLDGAGDLSSGRRFVRSSQAISPVGSTSTTSAASTRSTSAASTANMSSSLGGGSRGPVGAFAGSSGASTTSASPDYTKRWHENFCKNQEQFVYTDYLLLTSDSECLVGGAGRGESYA